MLTFLRKKVHPGDLAGGLSDLEMTWLLYCAGAATADRHTQTHGQMSLKQYPLCQKKRDNNATLRRKAPTSCDGVCDCSRLQRFEASICCRSSFNLWIRFIYESASGGSVHSGSVAVRQIVFQWAVKIRVNWFLQDCFLI